MDQFDRDRERALNIFAGEISIHLRDKNSYSFRTVSIDGVLCYPVIYRHRKIVNFECVNIYCRVKNKDGDEIMEKYSVYYKEYSSLKDAILTVEIVSKCFRLYNGDLVSPEDYKMAKMEERFLPYSESQVCCVCYENTLDTTLCDHYLCLKCREICLKKCVRDCPMCRNNDVVSVYNIDNGLINNAISTVLREVLDFEKTEKPSDDLVFLASRESGVYAFIDRIGNRRIRSPSSVSIENVPPENLSSELSEVSTVDGNNAEDDSDDLIAFDLSLLFEASITAEETSI